MKRRHSARKFNGCAEKNGVPLARKADGLDMPGEQIGADLTPR